MGHGECNRKAVTPMSTGPQGPRGWDPPPWTRRPSGARPQAAGSTAALQMPASQAAGAAGSFHADSGHSPPFSSHRPCTLFSERPFTRCEDGAKEEGEGSAEGRPEPSRRHRPRAALIAGGAPSIRPPRGSDGGGVSRPGETRISGSNWAGRRRGTSARLPSIRAQRLNRPSWARSMPGALIPPRRARQLPAARPGARGLRSRGGRRGALGGAALRALGRGAPSRDAHLRPPRAGPAGPEGLRCGSPRRLCDAAALGPQPVPSLHRDSAPDSDAAGPSAGL